MRLRAYWDPGRGASRGPSTHRFAVEREGRLIPITHVARYTNALDELLPASIVEVLAFEGLSSLERATAWAAATEPDLGFGPAAVEAAPAIPSPGKIVCVGLNYAEHVAEGGRAAPANPLLFSKFANAVIGDGQPIVRPEGTAKLDLEVELGVVIGRTARRVALESAMDHIAGYVVVNDVSARDWQGVTAALEEGQRGDGQWLRAKGSDTFLPMGSMLVTPDEVDPAAGLRIRSWRTTTDGVEHPMQNGSTADLIHDVPHLIAFITRWITLEPGDIVSTGTPSGVGVFQDPPAFLQPGDRVRCEIEGIGSVENPVIDWSEVV